MSPETLLDLAYIHASTRELAAVYTPEDDGWSNDTLLADTEKIIRRGWRGLEAFFAGNESDRRYIHARLGLWHDETSAQLHTALGVSRNETDQLLLALEEAYLKRPGARAGELLEQWKELLPTKGQKIISGHEAGLLTIFEGYAQEQEKRLQAVLTTDAVRFHTKQGEQGRRTGRDVVGALELFRIVEPWRIISEGVTLAPAVLSYSSYGRDQVRGQVTSGETDRRTLETAYRLWVDAVPGSSYWWADQAVQAARLL